MANILDLVKKELEPAEQVQHQYRVLHNRKEGLLVLTNTTLTFLEQRGFFHASYHNTLVIPYEKINKVITTASHALELEVEDKKYLFTSLGDILAKVIVEEITALIEHNQA